MAFGLTVIHENVLWAVVFHSYAVDIVSNSSRSSHDTVVTGVLGIQLQAAYKLSA